MSNPQISLDASKMSRHELLGVIASGCLKDFVFISGNLEMTRKFEEETANLKEQIDDLNLAPEDVDKIDAYTKAWKKAEIPDVEGISLNILDMLSKTYFFQMNDGLWIYELYPIYSFLWILGERELKKLKNAKMSEDFGM